MAKARRDFSSGMKDLQKTWSDKIERHIEEIDKVNERKGVLVFLSVVPHLFAVFFTVLVIWIAKPGSSEEGLTARCFVTLY